MARENLTPMMKQYLSIKNNYKDAIVLFRMGDFYETFYDDAKTVAKELNITLTARNRGPDGKNIPLAGVPYHALDTYLAKLVRKGYKVVICEQVEDPKKAKGLVRREVVRIVTPGTVIEDTLLNDKENNFIMCINTDRKGSNFGIAFLDMSTGEFFATEVEITGERYPEILTEATRFRPVEIIMPEWMQGQYDDLETYLRDVLDGVTIRYHTDSDFLIDIAENKLKEHFGVLTLAGMGLENRPLAVSAAGGVLSYVKELQRNPLAYITSLQTYSIGESMILDYTTVRNLELLRNIVDNTDKGTLIYVLDHTKTPMGARLLRKWMLHPELRVEVINSRLDAVQTLFRNPIERDKLRTILSEVSDLERIVSRISYGSANPRDIVALKNTLKLVPEIRRILCSLVEQGGGETATEEQPKYFTIDSEIQNKDPTENNTLIQKVLTDMNSLDDIVLEIERAIVDSPPTSLREGGIIKAGYSEELDDLKNGIKDAEKWIATLEAREKMRTGIKTLRVGFNKVFGYYIEVSKTYSNMVPDDYIRKQTLVNAERYVTAELKEKEALVLSAQERINDLEYEIFCKIREQIAGHVSDIKRVSMAIAIIDVLANFAFVSQANRYTRPEVDYGDEIHIVDGRHPVVEIVSEDVYVPNDTHINSKDHRIIILTGPNMAGKSTYMRQVALIVLMAQMGCFVPAKYAKIGVIDRIFTRVGAHDDLLRGQSTFMVEMVQLANILNNATPRSLIILDEIGRGTSTYDGLSLAWAVVEHIHFGIKGAKTLFATHYHHLCELERVYSDVKNYNVLVEEKGDTIVFVRKIIPGSTNRSYGIEVARLAGIPLNVVERAKEILRKIEEENIIDIKDLDNKSKAISVKLKVSKKPKGKGVIKTYTQYVLFPFDNTSEKGGMSDKTKDKVYKAVVDKLKSIDVDNLTPLEALSTVYHLKKMLEKGEK